MPVVVVVMITLFLPVQRDETDVEAARRATQQQPETLEQTIEGVRAEAVRNFESSKDNITARLDAVQQSTEREEWAVAVSAGEELERELGPLFVSSVADTPEVSEIGARLENLFERQSAKLRSVLPSRLVWIYLPQEGRSTVRRL